MSQVKSSYYTEKLSIEMMKFINVYNSISKEPFSFKCVDKTKYEYIVRVLGNYISKNYNKSTWVNSVINFPFGGEYIDMSLFKGTKYEKSVEDFLELLKDAFHTTIESEIYTYFKSPENEFSRAEEDLCLQFYQKVSSVKEEIFKETFNDSTTDICSKESIGNYSQQLKEFDDFVKSCSNPSCMNVLERFDKVMKKIIREKKQVDVFFDDNSCKCCKCTECTCNPCNCCKCL